MKINKKIIYLFSIFLSILLLYIIIKKIDITVFYQQLLKIPPISILTILSLSLLIIPFMTYRYLWILKTLNSKCTYKYIFNTIIKSNIANIFMPGKSGDLIKGLLLKKHFSLTNAYIATFIERIIDLLILGFICLFFSLITQIHYGLIIGILLVASIIIFFIFSIVFHKIIVKILVYKRLKKIYLDYYQAVYKLRCMPKYLFLTILSSLVVWLLNLLIIVITYKSITSSELTLSILAVFPLAVIIGALPISFNGIGTRDAALVYFLSNTLPIEQIFTISTIYTVATYFWIGFISSLYLLFHSSSKSE